MCWPWRRLSISVSDVCLLRFLVPLSHKFSFPSNLSYLWENLGQLGAVIYSLQFVCISPSYTIISRSKQCDNNFLLSRLRLFVSLDAIRHSRLVANDKLNIYNVIKLNDIVSLMYKIIDCLHNSNFYFLIYSCFRYYYFLSVKTWKLEKSSLKT